MPMEALDRKSSYDHWKYMSVIHPRKNVENLNSGLFDVTDMLEGKLLLLIT